MSNTRDNPAISGRCARRLASDLYHTTNIGVAAIAARVGVSRERVYRWLHSDGVLLERSDKNRAGSPTEQDAVRTSDAVAELRRQLAVLIAQVDRLDRLLKALVEPMHHNAD